MRKPSYLVVLRYKLVFVQIFIVALSLIIGQRQQSLIIADGHQIQAWR